MFAPCYAGLLPFPGVHLQINTSSNAVADTIRPCLWLVKRLLSRALTSGKNVACFIFTLLCLHIKLKMKEISHALFNQVVQQDRFHQRWINLAVLKQNLRRWLFNFEYNLAFHWPCEERENILREFHTLKDMLWQAVGAMHGNMSIPIDLEVCFRASTF